MKIPQKGIPLDGIFCFNFDGFREGRRELRAEMQQTQIQTPADATCLYDLNFTGLLKLSLMSPFLLLFFLS